MTCKLCLQDKPLVDAHIIPRSMYPFDFKNYEPLFLVSGIENPFRTRSRIGEFDRNLVCADCESLFSPWDAYAKYLLAADVEESAKFSQGGVTYGHIVSEYDFAKLKLFFVSLLWRADRTTRPMFDGIDVGHFRDRLREMILNGDPGSTEEFSICLARFDNQKLGTAVLNPHREKWYGINYSRFYLAGHVAYIKVDRRPTPDFLSDFSFRPDSPLCIIWRDFEGSAEKELMVSIAKAAAAS